MPGPKLTLLACLAATCFMCGLIWFVQVVHYPLFDRVAPGEFPRFHVAHARRTTWVVAPPMLVELVGALLLVAWRPAGSPPWLAWLGLALAVTAWVSTALVQVPLHGRLAAGFDARAHRALVASNAVRTFAWTAHAAVLLVMTGRALRD